MNEKPKNHGRRTISDDERDYLDGWAAHVSRSVSKSERSRSKRNKSRDRSERSSRSRSPRSRSRDRRYSCDSRDPGPRSEFQIYVGTFRDASITNKLIRERFQEYGNVVGLKRPMFSAFNGKAPYCFVTFDSERPVCELLKKGSVMVAGQRVQIKDAVRNNPQVPPIPVTSEDDERRRTRSSSRERKMKRKKDKRRNNSRENSSGRNGGRRRRRRSGRSRSRSCTRSRTRSHTRSRTRSRSRDRSAESGEILELSSDPDVAASGSAKSRLGPKPSRRSSRSSSSGSTEWREVQESRSGNRDLSGSSRSPISKRLGPRIHPDSDEEEEGRVSVK